MNVRVLIAVDGSEYSSELLAVVCHGKFWEKGTEMRLLTVVEPASSEDDQQQFFRQSQVILSDRLQMLKRCLPECHVDGEVIEGDPRELISQIAESWNADLIVIGAHGAGGAKRLHLGSIAASVVNSAPCSVEVVKLWKRRNLGRNGATAQGNETKVSTAS